MHHARSFKSNLHHANSSWRIHLRCVMIIRTLTEKIKEQSVGFSQIVSTFKTWERHLCKVLETWGQFTAGSHSAKYSKDSVTSKTNHKTLSRPKHTILLHHVMKQRAGEKNSRTSKTEVQLVGTKTMFQLICHRVCCSPKQCFSCQMDKFFSEKVCPRRLQPLTCCFWCLFQRRIGFGRDEQPSRNQLFRVILLFVSPTTRRLSIPMQVQHLLIKERSQWQLCRFCIPSCC